MTQTMYDKIWHHHVVEERGDGVALLYIDRQIIHEVTSPQAFEGLRLANRKLRRRDANIAVPDHNVPTKNRHLPNPDPSSKEQLETLEQNVDAFDVNYIPMDDIRQGIVHVVGPEQGITQPGITMVCGDSHTSTNGAFGALAFGIGTSEIEHAFATQTLVLKKSKSMRVKIEGTLPFGCSAKDMALAVIGKLGTAGGTGYVIEYAGSMVEGLSMEGRMTLCNMSIEAGARAGMVAPDETTFNYIKGRPFAPKGGQWNAAVAYWKSLVSDEGANFDKEVTLTQDDIVPLVTWGTSPEDVIPVTAEIPAPSSFADPNKQVAAEASLDYMGLAAGTPMQEVSVDRVFVGSCTNSRIEDLRQAAAMIKGRKISESVKEAIIVPGSGLVKHMAEEEGLDKLFIEAGFEWREPGCSMCLAMNPDKAGPGEHVASTSNRNFVSRQGPGARTHLVSPAMAVGAAIAGHFVDVRNY
ncbi:3-isopropylmalate dehydratase large subunit [Temperatibacter marinus]|uniref:3-isopropylmalate dehydratase large subunit n=1 Tax=Temperatibacter marinus TaxID=1456591 RepID=A0AA52EG03_9PROT|nr:3-isopropylmalate dehydratase large subunit [Temperatibacter marinus]WND01834.1 3-isopropylmalate dehydratase large subunit [Temperatibacter marinus]